MIGARGCVELVQAESRVAGACAPGTYRVSVAWQGLNKTAAPTLACGAGAFGTTAQHRAISTNVVVATLGCT
jgi:type IV pilus assembly protein PilV